MHNETSRVIALQVGLAEVDEVCELALLVFNISLHLLQLEALLQGGGGWVIGNIACIVYIMLYGM